MIDRNNPRLTAYALGEMKADQEYDVEVLRGSERVKLKITPQMRK